MRAIIQRVSSASVAVGKRAIGRIDRGLLVLLGIEQADTEADGEWLARKITRLRIFPDEADQMDKSVADIGGGILVVSQFTLHASTAKGTRPSYHAAARPETARPLYEQFVAHLTDALGRSVATGEFGAMMAVELVNDGPVTLIIDSKTRD
jgi:D-aminoacyl-tRNA deacylase